MNNHESINIWMVLFAVGVGLAIGWLIYRLAFSQTFEISDSALVAPQAAQATPATPTPCPQPTPKPYDPWRDRPKVGKARLPGHVPTPRIATPTPERRPHPTPRPKKKK